MALAFLVALLVSLEASPPTQPVDCERLWSQADAAYEAKEFEALWRQSARALDCYGSEASAKRLQRLHFYRVFGLRRSGREEEAIVQAGRFLQNFRSLRDSLWLGAMHRHRGYIYYTRGQLVEAAHDYERATSYATSPRQRSYLHYNTGTVYQRMRSFADARRHYERATHFLRPLDFDDPGVRLLRAQVLTSRADLLLETSDRHRTVLRLALKALPLLPDSLSTTKSREQAFRTFLTLADAYRLLGETGQAERYLDRAARRARLDEHAHRVFLTSYKRGVLYEDMGRLDRADEAYREALAQVEGARHDDYRKRLFLAMGSLYEQQQDWTRAEQFYRRAVDVIEAYRMSLRSTGWSAAAFDEWRTPYRGLVRVLLAQERPRAAFGTLARTRARHLRDLHTRARVVGAMPSAQRARFDSLSTALGEVRQQLEQHSAPSDTSRQLRRRATRLSAARAILLRLPPPRDTFSLARVQQRLAPRGRALLSYFLTGPAPGGGPVRSHVFVLTADTLRAVPLQVTPAEVRTLLADSAPLLAGTSAEALSLSSTRFDLRPLRRLHDAIFAPAAAFLEEGQPLAVVPDGPLFRLPFALLPRKAPSRYGYAEADFLLRHHPLSARLSALPVVSSRGTRPAALRRQAQTRTDFLAFGRAQFDGAVLSQDTLPPLPGATREIRQAGRLFRRADIFLGAEATEGTFHRMIDEQPTVLHLASHALARPRSPLSSALVLSPDSAGADTSLEASRDGLLHLSELQDRQFSVPLVTLSACETASGEQYAGEGMQSLQYAFRAAGARSTLSYLWRVEDEHASRLSRTFYRHLIAGEPRDIALQKAQVALLDGSAPGRRSPFFWAAPLFYGETSALSLAPRPIWRRPRMVGFALGALLLSLLAGTLLRRPFWKRENERAAAQ